MCKEVIKKMYNLSKEYGTDQITIITNHLKFTGTLCADCEKDKEDYIIMLADAKMWRLEDICTCKEPECNCDEATFCPMDCLNINIRKMVGYSFKK